LHTSVFNSIHSYEDQVKIEFWRIFQIFPQGLNPFKIQRTLKLESVPKFIL
jgi:hypothetical protein